MTRGGDSNGEKMGWVSSREHVREKRASTVANHMTKTFSQAVWV